MRILFLTEGTTVPASRFRVGQFLVHFRDRGIECVVRPGYGDLYNRIGSTPLGPVYKLSTRLGRLVRSLDAADFDVVFFQRPTLPFTPLPEFLVAALNEQTIFDVDDAIFMDADGSTNRRKAATFDAIIDRVCRVVCGNSFLAERAGRPEKTSVIPTVIDCRRYTPAQLDEPKDSREVIIGWMGTASNFISLRTVVPVVHELLEERDSIRFRIVSNATFSPLQNHPRCEQIRWSADTEIDLLRSFDIGLMPLADTPATRGKCGFKMIQYMAVGTPVIASAIGANVEIFEGSEAGFLAGEPQDWREAMETLVDDERLRDRCGAAAREHVVEHYSIRSVIDDYIELFAEVAS